MELKFLKRAARAVAIASFVTASAAVMSQALAQDVKLPRQLVIATDAEGGVANTMGNGFATILTKYSGTKATVLPVGNPDQWIDMARSEEVDLGTTSQTGLSWTYWGNGPNKGKPNKIINIIALGAPSSWGLFIPKDENVKTADDLKKWLAGKRLTHGWINPSVDRLNLAFLGNLGFSNLEEAKLTAVPVSNYSVFASLWTENRVDVVGMPVGIPLVQQMSASRPGRFVPLYDTPEALERLQNVEPSYYVAKRAPGVLGVDEEMPLLSYDYALTARSSLDNAVVKRVLETLYEHQPELSEIHRTLKGWMPAEKVWATTNFSFPYHPGAVEFYKSKGWWTEEIDKKQKMLVAKAKG